MLLYAFGFLLSLYYKKVIFQGIFFFTILSYNLISK